ncbi:hypothetical protein SUGI_1092840 [Cryptomeria japonica]|nr:hypothetical protein SUGI_1092840 [Cryptomeria japonica]
MPNPHGVWLRNLSCSKLVQQIIPIFYHVHPSDLRWIDQRKGWYAHVFTEHVKKDRYKPEKLDEWKWALYKSSFLHGYMVDNIMDEGTVLKNITNRVYQITKKAPLWIAKQLARLDELVQDFESVARKEKLKKISFDLLDEEERWFFVDVAF